MRIVSVRLINYRCFEDSGIIPIGAFTVLIGRNDGGKSSVLSALDKFLQKRGRIEDEDHRKIWGDDAETMADEVEIQVKVCEANGESLDLRLRRNISGSEAEREGVYEVLTDAVDDPRLNVDIDTLLLPDLKTLCESVGLSPTGRQDRKETFREALKAHKDSLPTSLKWSPCGKSLLDRRPSPYAYLENAETDPQAAIRQALNQHYQTAVLPAHRSTLTTIRRTVEKELNKRAEEVFTPLLQEHCRTVASVSVDLAEGTFENLSIAKVRIAQTNSLSIDWQHIGRGRRREMSLAIFRANANLLEASLDALGEDANGFIASFDEPDSNLDYEAQRRVTRILNGLSASPYCQVIVASHSINLIDSCPIENLVFFEGERLEYRTRQFTADAEDSAFMEEIQSAMGVRNSMVFNERGFVFCEGATEMVVLPKLFRHLHKQNLAQLGIQLVNGRDGENAARCAGILAKNHLKVHVVLDADCAKKSWATEAKLSANHLRLNTDVTLLGDAEVEDLFTDETWVECLEANYPKDDGSPWLVEEVSAFRSAAKFSKEVIDAIVELSITPVSKPTLAGHVVATCIRRGEVPKTLTDLLTNLKKIFVPEDKDE